MIQDRVEAVRRCMNEHVGIGVKAVSEITGIPVRSASRYMKHIKQENEARVKQEIRRAITNERKAIYTNTRNEHKNAPQAAIHNVNVSVGRKHRLVIGLPDMHLPNPRGLYADSAKAVLRFCSEMRPDEIVIMGDFLDLQSVSHWNAKTPGRIVDHNLGRDFKSGNFCLDSLQQMTDKITYLEGNHEAWLTKAMEKDLGLREHLELRACLRLPDRGIELIPENGVYRIGDASIIHGWTTGVYHSRNTCDAAMTNVFYGHTHDIQSFSKTKRPGHNPIIAQSCGCLCDQNPLFLRGKPNRWAAGFLVLYVRDDGTFSHYVPVIVNGKFIFEGKEYSA